MADIIVVEDNEEIGGLLSDFLGADDYIEKPYDIDILLAKVNGIFKSRYSSKEIIDGNIRLDKAGRHLYVDGREAAVRSKEFDLLLYLMENKGKALAKEELFNKIWGFGSESEPGGKGDPCI